jgi:hypothetical protein
MYESGGWHHSKSVFVSLPAGGNTHLVELNKVNESLLLRIPDCDVLDILPLSSAAAVRLLDCLQVTKEEEEAWTQFLTKPSSLEEAVSLAKQVLTSELRAFAHVSGSR